MCGRIRHPKEGSRWCCVWRRRDGRCRGDSFFQNNFFLLPELVQQVRGMLKRGGARHLIDLFCGVGFFGIELAVDVESFVGVEYDRMAVATARRNASARGAANGEFIAGSAEEVLPGEIRRFSPEATSVLLDPPRKGCWPSNSTRSWWRVH